MTQDTIHSFVKGFCVGQAKSGTTSIFGLLNKNYKAAHEPEREEILKMILKRAKGNVNENEFNQYLILRDQRLTLDYDIAWANQFLLPNLLKCFPEAKYIVLIRDPYSWIESIIGHFISREIPSDVREFMDWWFKPDIYPHTADDTQLKEKNAYSLAAFLHAWDRHIEACLKIPVEKRVIIKTHEIPSSLHQLSQFLKIPTPSLDNKNRHLNQSTWKGTVHTLINKNYFIDTVNKICGRKLDQFFPNFKPPI